MIKLTIIVFKSKKIEFAFFNLESICQYNISKPYLLIMSNTTQSNLLMTTDLDVENVDFGSLNKYTYNIGGASKRSKINSSYLQERWSKNA